MPDAIPRITDQLIGTSIIVAETIALELRERLLDALRYGSHYEIHEAAKAIFDEYEGLLVENIANADLLAWLAGYNEVSQKLPLWAIEQFGNYRGIPPGKPPSISGLLGGAAGDEPRLRFPIIEKAAENLFRREILTPEEFADAAGSIKAKSFSVARVAREDVLERIRTALAETTRDGASLPEFKNRLGEDLQKSFIGPAHIENVYRTNIQAAFSAGHDELANDPIVVDLFPYQEYLSIHDARARHEHRELERYGIQGTNVYRRDDPFWQYFTPPWDYQCRCGRNLLTIEAAARRGIDEAKEWLRTGFAPLKKDWRLDLIPFRPKPGFMKVAA